MSRRPAFAAVAAVAIALAVPVPAFAAPPPTLTGQVFSDSSTPFGSLLLECVHEPGEDLRMSFRASSTTEEPFPGDYTERGEITVQRVGEFEMRVVTAKAEFTIESPVGQVVGTKRFLSHPTVPITGTTDCEHPPGLDTGEPVVVSYDATITTTAGVFTDRGTATMDFEDQDRILPTNFTERFTSSLSAPEQEHSVLFGKRTPGTSWSAMSANTKRATPFVFYFTGNVRRIHAYIDGKGATSGSQVVRAVLYRHQPGVGPGAYVTRSFDFTVPAGMSARWVPFWLAPIPRLEPGVYWLGLQSGGDHGVARYAWDSSPNARRYNIDPFADGASDPFGTTFTDDQQMSLFAFGDYTN